MRFYECNARVKHDRRISYESKKDQTIRDQSEHNFFKDVFSAIDTQIMSISCLPDNTVKMLNDFWVTQHKKTQLFLLKQKEWERYGKVKTAFRTETTALSC